MKSRRVLKGLQAIWLRHHWSLEYYSFPCCRAEMMKKTCFLHFPSNETHQNVAYFWTWWSEYLSSSKILWFLLRFRMPPPSKLILILHNSLKSKESLTATSLVVQWLRLCTPNEGAWVPLLVRELDPICCNWVFTCAATWKILQAQQRSTIPHAATETQHSPKINN